jgi:protein phosphatase
MYKLFKRTHVPGIFEVQMSAACDPGVSRDHNEDAVYIGTDEEQGYYLAIVCDGMGGHNAGEVASAIAVETIKRCVSERFADSEPAELLEAAFAEASARIDEQAVVNPDASGMGCTCVLVLGIKERVFFAHAGDSRGYRVRNGELQPMTADHTMVQEMVDNGLITEEQASVHPYRGRISRCLGHGKNKGQPTISEGTFEAGDNILLCSDGLSDVVSKGDILPLMGQLDVRSSCRRLVDAANGGGGPDNISAIILRRMV